MKKIILFNICFVSAIVNAQSIQSVDTVSAPASYENVFIKPIASDSLSSSFVIFIKKEVKKHKHIYHTEHVYVLQGEGNMILGEKNLSVKKGDVIVIPKNTIHALKVTSQVPVKIISIQSPYFDGKDRVIVDDGVEKSSNY